MVTTFDARLRDLRERSGLSQAKVAASLGVADTQVSRWENGNVLPGFQYCCRLAEFYGVSLDYLMSGRDPETISAVQQ